MNTGLTELNIETLNQRSWQIKELAVELGFEACGICRAEKLNDDETRLNEWLVNGYQANMEYMQRHVEKRLDPSKLVEGSKSVIVVLQTYNDAWYAPGHPGPYISRYACRADYHEVLKTRLNQLLEAINQNIAPCTGRAFTDSAPLLEKALAQKAGLGWIGNNTLLLNKKLGSWFFIAELVVDLELAYDEPVSRSYCGTCRRCIEACPSGALLAPGLIDSGKCISYCTIESKGNFTADTPLLDHRIFGCDRCQEVCPWNTNGTHEVVNALKGRDDIFELDLACWQAMSADQFSEIFTGTALKRTGYKHLMRNVQRIREESEEK